MCTSPILIKNPNYQQSCDYIRRTTDVSSAYIRVPCGYCSQCRFIKQSSLYQRILLESENSMIYFLTLTYNNESVLHFELGDDDFLVADYSDFQKYIKRLRKVEPFSSRGLRYIVCREYGGKRGRPHWHALFFLRRLPDDLPLVEFELEKQLKSLCLFEWRRNLGSTRNPVYVDITTYCEKFRRGKLVKNYDLHLVRQYEGSIDDVLFYVLKYMCKDSKLFKKIKFCLDEFHNFEHNKDYYKDLNLLKPKIWKSVKFGINSSTEEKIRQMIKISRTEGSLSPYFIYKNHRFPLSRFYKSKFMTSDDVLFFAEKTFQKYGKIVYDGFDPVELDRLSKSFDRSLEHVDTSDVLDLFEDD